MSVIEELKKLDKGTEAVELINGFISKMKEYNLCDITDFKAELHEVKGTIYDYKVIHLVKGDNILTREVVNETDTFLTLYDKVVSFIHGYTVGRGESKCS
jgi:hypothetical protein